MSESESQSFHFQLLIPHRLLLPTDIGLRIFGYDDRFGQIS